MPQDVKKVNNLSISNLPDKLPDYATPVTERKLPDYATKVDENQPEPSSNIIDTISKHIFEAPEFIKSGAKSISDYISNPTLSDESSSFMPYIKGALGGMTEGAASLLSPANIAQTAFPELGALNKGLGALQGVSGANKLAHGDISGLGDIGFGILGAKSKSPTKELPSYAEPVVHESGKLPISEKDWNSDILRPGGLTLKNLKSDLPITESDWNSTALKPGGMMDQFGGMRDNSNFTEGSGGLSDIAAGRFTRHAMPNEDIKKPFIKDYWITDAQGNKKLNPKYQFGEGNKITAKFKGWQEDGQGGHIALYDVVGGPLDKSTVSEKSLKSAGIDIPETPKFVKEDSPEKVAAINRQKSLREGKSIPTLKNLFSDQTGAVRFGLNKELPINSKTKTQREPQPEIVNKLVKALTEVAPKRELQEKGYSEERARRFANAEKVTTYGLKGHYEAKGHLKGELPKVDFERTKLSQSDVNDLVAYIRNSKYLLQGEKIRATDGLLKLLSAKHHEVPQRSELALLGEVFGKDFNDTILMHGGLGGPINKDILMKGVNASKAIKSSIDLSAPLRQGLPLIHKKEFWNALGPMVKSWGNKEYYNDVMSSIRERPKYLIGKEAGLKLTGLENDLGHREEAFQSFQGGIMNLGVNQSERSFTAFLNKLRSDTFDTLWDNATDAGVKLFENGKITKEGKDIARFVNNATGRGDLGSFSKTADEFLSKNATELNAVLYSPRLMASRLTALNPNYYVQLSPFARKEALKSLLALASASVVANTLFKTMGAKVNTNLVGPTYAPNLKMFPVNADFAKSKFGNTRMDPNAGFQQDIVAASRLITGKTANSNTNEISELGKGYKPQTRLTVMGNFLANKESPIAAFAHHMLTGIDSNLQPIKFSKEIINMYEPMLINDLIEVYKDDPNHLPLGIGAALGMGMQTYKATPKKSNQMRISIR